MGITVLVLPVELQEVPTKCIFSDFWDWGEFQNGMYVKGEETKTIMGRKYLKIRFYRTNIEM